MDEKDEVRVIERPPDLTPHVPSTTFDTETKLIRIPLLLCRLRTFINHVPHLSRERHTQRKQVTTMELPRRRSPLLTQQSQPGLKHEH